MAGSTSDMSFRESRGPALLPTKPWFCFTGELLGGYEQLLAAHKRSHSYSHATHNLRRRQSSLCSLHGKTLTNKHESIRYADDEYSTASGGSTCTATQASADYATDEILDLDTSSEQSIKGQCDEAHETKRIDTGRTLIIMNLHPSLTQADLRRSMHSFISAGQVSVLYAPITVGQRAHKNLGFAFVHLKTEDAANDFIAEWQGSKALSGVYPINIRNARIQGVDANMKQWSKTKTNRLRNAAFRPIIFDGALGDADW